MRARIRQLCGLALALGIVAAIWIQDHTDALPQGLFNEGRAGFGLASNATLIVAIVLAALFAYEVARGRELPLGGLARSALVFVAFLELCLWGVDAGFVSGDPRARIGGPYQEARTPAGEAVFFRKSHAASPFGFRTAEEVPKQASRPRLLFLGDSYTEGSGRDLACNYPDVVAQRLSARLGRDVEVMNAGVGGYGPLDALHLLELLQAEGYSFDAVVFNLFLENDFTDNLAGTERRVVAGINFRFPRSLFLKIFHPLNWRSFRFPLFLVRVGGLVRSRPDLVTRDTGECRLEGEPLDDVSDSLRSAVERRLRSNYHLRLAYAGNEIVEDSIAGLLRVASDSGAALVLVVFPDRVLVDPTLRDAIGFSRRSADYDLERWYRIVAEWSATIPTIDLRSTLEGRTEAYRARDTHLNDLGNVVVGERVAEELAWMIGEQLVSP